MFKRLSLSIILSLVIILTVAAPVLADDPIPGEIRMIAGGSAPDGWVLCDGSAYLQDDYPQLYSTIGDTYGSAPSGYFFVPDFRNRFPLASFSGIGSCLPGECFYTGDTGGEISHTLIITETARHAHYVYRQNGANPAGSTVGMRIVSEGYGDDSVLTSYTGGGQPHNNMPPYLAVYFIIYVGGTPTPTATPTNTPTATATPTGTVTSTYLPLVDTYTHTLRSGQIYTVPLETSFGQIFSIGAGFVLGTVLITAFVFRVIYRQ